MTVAAFPGLGECDLVTWTRQAGGTAISIPVPGFGSTDCRRCAAHLLVLTGELPAGFFDGLYQ